MRPSWTGVGIGSGSASPGNESALRVSTRFANAATVGIATRRRIGWNDEFVRSPCAARCFASRRCGACGIDAAGRVDRLATWFSANVALRPRSRSAGTSRATQGRSRGARAVLTVAERTPPKPRSIRSPA
ncbi:hypothetical protein AQ477_22255 [Burkholderia thailandensis]|nr:hypothetical protein AQ477_22255 [Burkholderia thailandensis]KXF58406.1 hypothetical protein AQ476_27380 [Burkholderia thailandensis]